MTIDTPAATSFLAPTAETLIELVAIALESQRGGGQGFVITQSGELAFRSEGKELLIARSEELLEAANVPHEHVAQLLNADPALLLTLADAAEIVSFAELGVEFQAGFIAAHGQPVGQYEGLAGLSDETLRDGLFSNQLNNDGTLIEALGGVNGASIYFSVSLELKTFANLFGRVNAGVGVDLYHLPPLPDEDYIRGMDPTIFPVIEEGGGISAEEPTTVPDVFTVSEDTPLAGDLAANDSVPNPGAIFALSGPPPANGTFVLNPNGTFTFDPDPDFSGEVTFTYTLTDPASGTVRTSVVVIDVIAVADAPIVTAANTVTDEDIPVPLAGLTVALDDTDGSETIAVTISGVPTGATLSVGTEIAPGVWSISPADLATVELTPPADFHGVIDLVIEATATEGSNGNTSTTSVPFTVTVEAEADLPNLTPGTSATSEDQPAPVGQSIAVGVTDTDGSEAITDVSVTNAPAGAVVDWTVTGAAVVTAVPGGFSITGPESDIIATLATLTVLPPQNSDDDFILDIATTATDADGSTSTNTGQHPVTVEAVADVPSAIVAPATGNEDMPIPLVGLGGTLADTDGSEVQTFSISNIPAGATLSAGTVQPDGSVLLTSAELAGLTITPPLHFSGTFPLTLTSIATETSNGSSEQISDTFNVTVTAVADAPVVTGGSSSVDEDVTTVFGADISYALVDMDGSEVVSQVAVTGITAGADITFTAAGGATVTAVAGGYTITGPEADIRATLDTFAYDPADDDDTNVQLTVEVTTTDDGGSTASATDTHDLIVAAVADAPSGSGVGAGNEDTAIAVPVTTQLNDTDGSETITQAVVTAPTGVVLGGFGPSGATVVQAGQDWTITGTPAQIDAALAAMTATPPNNSDADFNLLVTLTATETSPVGGEVTTATADTTFAVPVTVTAVADAPNVVVPVAPIPTEEDTAVAVGAALGGSLNDTDGSETISYRIEGLPAGATPSVGTVTPGGLVLTAAELAVLTITPPQDFHGSIPLTLVSIATEGSNADTAETSDTFSILVDAQADTPSLTAGSSTVNEDTSVNFGAAVTYASTDIDTSEAVSEVTIIGFPTGSLPTFTTAPGATVTPTATGFTVTGTEAGIRATVASFAVTAPSNSGDDFTLDVSVTVTDADGSTATTTGTHPIDVVPVADTPDVTGGNYNTDEDTAVALTGLTGALTDTDGSETLTYRVTGVDPAASFTTGTDAGGGVWTFTKAELDAGLTYNPPPQADGTFNMVLEATATEDEGDTATNTANIIVTVASVSDAPTLTTGASAIDEDQPAAVGASLTYASTDPDGSEVISEVAITDIPAGSVTDFTVSGAAVVTPVPGGFTITGPEADIRATVASLTVTPPAHSADDFVLQIAVTVMDGLDTATTTGTHPVTVTPVADTPILTGGTINGDEDTPVPLTVLAGTTPDMDGSETIAFQISGVPAGTSLSVGTDLGGGVWALTPAELDIVAFNPATNFSGTVPLVLSATTTDSNGDTATANTPFDVVIEAQADAPTVVPGSSTINEDTPGLIGDVMTYGLVDTDGSEVISGVVVDGAPAGTVFGFTASGAVVVTLVAGGVSISGTEAEIRATLDTLTLQAPDDTGDDIALNVAVTTTDDDGSTATTNATHNVDVVPVVDTPDVTGGAFTTDEDTTVLLTGVAALLTDTDGSESIVHTISGVPTGASFTTGTDLGGGNWSFTPAELAAGITFTPPVDEAAVTYNLTISATSTEAEGGSATASAPITITIDPVADPATLNTGTTTATEDNGVIAFGADITVAGNDTDNSESMSLELSGLPPTGTVSWNTGLPGTVTLGAPGTYTIAGTPQEVAAILATFGVEPATHDAFDFNVGIAVTTTDGTDTTTVNGTHAVTITAVADAPVVTGGSSSVDEDVTTVFGADISYALVDTDGSEVVSQVAVTGIPAGADITFTPAGGATVTAVAGGYTITGPEADIRATLDTFAYDPADDDDTNVQLTVEVTTTDDGGSTASTTDTHDLIVAAVADAPSGSGSGTGNEDTAIAVPVTTQLNDTDGSETITQAVVTAPTGVVLGGFGPSGATVVQAGQDWTITGTPAQIDAALAAMTATPPNNSDADFNLSVTLTATETSPVGGEITTATADTTFTVPVTVTAVADAPNVVVPGAPIPTEEDTAVAVGAALGGSLNDTDGSETISYRIEGLPAGATPSVGTVTPGGLVLTAAELAVLTITPPQDFHGSIPLTLVSIATEGSNADTAETSDTFSILVDAQADTPSLTAGSSTVNEDTSVNFGAAVTYASTDIDTSEAVSEVTIIGFPTGSLPTFTTAPGATVTPTATGFTVTGTEAGIRATVASFAVTAPSNSGDDFTLDVSVTVTDADGSTATTTGTHPIDVVPVADTPDVTGGNYNTDEDTAVALTGLTGALTDTDGSETLTYRVTGVDPAASFTTGTDAGGGVWTFTKAELDAGLTYNPPPQADGTFNMVLEATATEDEGDTASNTANIIVTVAPILDAPNLVAGSSSANEDTVIALGSDIDLTIDDLDGSQTLTVVLDGIPAASITSFNGGLPGTVTQTGPEQWTFTGTAAETNALLDSFTVQPPADTDDNFIVAVSATTVENGGATATSNANHTVTISAVADAPNLSQIAAATGDEDTVIDIPITVGLNDTDGSETLDFVLISGVPASATFAIATTGSAVAVDEGGGVWRVTGLTADIVSTLATGVTILPGANLGDDIPLTVTAQSIESNPTPGGEIAVLTAQTVLPIVVDVIPIADVVSSTGGSYAGEEDTNIALTGLAGSSIDTDGSEVVTFEIQSVPIGASFVDAGGNPVGVNAGGGVWEFTAAQIAAGISFTPPFNTHGTYNLILEATTTELGNPASSQVSTAPIEIVVDAQADRPNITGNSNGLEDTAINFGASYNVSLFDTDGSESLTSITIELQGGQTATFVETSGATVAVSGTTYTITGPEAGLQDTLDTFSLTPPAQSDVDIPVRIIATTEDADGSTNSRTSNRNIRVRAVADTPDGTANNISGQEDMAIVLNLMAIDSVDTDGSEILSVRLFDLPAGSVVGGSTAGGVEYMRSGNDWIVTAPDTATLNAALSSATYTPPNDFSGVVSASMEVISTESATGNQVAVPTASVVRTFDITVAQVADAPELRVTNATEGAAGLEDTPIRLVVDIRAGDDDGSESITNITISDIPAGATIVDAAGNPLGALQGDGTVILTGAELPQLHVLAPADSNDDFQLSIAATATENPQGLPGDGDAEIGTATIDVAVIGVADPANITVAPIISDEDNAIPIGAAITGGLSDTDGSESLFYVLTGLPAGIIPSVGTFIGSGWQISATDMASLTIQPPANFSGDYIAEIAPALQIRAITQENDGDQTSVTVPLSIIVNPVVDAQSWNPSAQVLEDNDIPLSGAAPAGLVDDDGSEQIVSYTFNLSNIVAAAGIGATVTDTADFIANFINGTFTDNLDGTITVLPGNLSGVSFDATAFPDSNRDFGVPLAVEFSDTAGGTVVTSVVNDVFAVDLVGDADLPTVFADDYTGDDNTIFALNPTGIEFGGTTSDVDVANGQAQSETIYYIVSGLRDPGTPILAFVDSAGDPIGLNNQDGTWLLTPAEIADLNVITPSGESGTANLTLTTVATENDGDQATNATTFTIDITANGVSGTPIEPLPPIVTVSPMTVGEDGTQVVLVDVQPDPADPSTSTPSIAVVLTGIPADATVTGAFFNPTNNTWVTDAATISAGNVTIAPAADYSGPIDFTVTATATNNEQQQASASNVPVNIDVAPVADGPAIALTSPGGGEDSAIDLNIGLSLQDTNGLVPEQIQDPVVITIPVGASLSAGTNTGGGVWELTQAELAGLQITPAADDDTDISVTVQATSVEPANGDTRTTTENLTIPVTAAADAAIVTVADSTGDEDTAITLTGLSATLSDTDGSEVLSTTLSGVPEGTILSAGSNNGDGTWTIDPADWAGLTLTPPMNYSGTIALELVAFTLESTGQTSETREAFTVTVDPVADGVVFTALPQSGDAGAPIALNLDLSPGDETGNAAGENPSELITVVLTGAVDFVATSTGGSLVKTGANEWTFSGTAAEGNSLAVTSFGDTTDFDLGVLINATDGASVGAAVAATIPITVTNAGGNFTGTVASETLTGGAGADLIAGGGGSDILTGGAGADLFTWAVGDTAGGATDTVTDFALGTDVLDLSELISAFDPATDVISDFISLSESGGDTTVQISPTGTGGPLDDVVELTGVSGTDLASLIAAGSLVV